MDGRPAIRACLRLFSRPFARWVRRQLPLLLFLPRLPPCRAPDPPCPDGQERQQRHHHPQDRGAGEKRHRLRPPAVAPEQLLARRHGLARRPRKGDRRTSRPRPSASESGQARPGHGAETGRARTRPRPRRPSPARFDRPRTRGRAHAPTSAGRSAQTRHASDPRVPTDARRRAPGPR